MTNEQKNFLRAEGKVLLKACPGSGKTYTVVKKLLSYVENWKEFHCGVAVLSFTNVASNEIFDKAKFLCNDTGGLGYPHFVGTLDSFIDEFIVLRYGHLFTNNNVRPRIAISDFWNIPFKWESKCHANGCVKNIDQFSFGVDGNFYKGKKLAPCEIRNWSMLPCQRYKKILLEKGIIFQNDAATFAFWLLKKYPQIVKALVERFPIIIVDEVQDTSANQMAVLDLLANAGVKSMFLVGDPDQAIYEWRNANPECFLEKINDANWKTLQLTGNFRCSQNICNVTSYFSASLQGKDKNNAVGGSANECQKPILLLTNGESEEDVTDYFLKKCVTLGIEISQKNVAVLTRGRIHSEVEIKDLWKSRELELFAKAAYEWRSGSRKTAYQKASEVAFKLIFNEEFDEFSTIQRIRESGDETVWKNFIINILTGMPDINMGIGEWVAKCGSTFNSVCDYYNYNLSADKKAANVFIIKQRDKKSPDFKQIPLKKFFENNSDGTFTRSSIHGIKGETFEAVLLYIKSRTGETITPKFLMNGDLNLETMRMAYVAMTRPRRLLMVAMPNDPKIKDCNRFPESLWSYETISENLQDPVSKSVSEVRYRKK